MPNVEVRDADGELIHTYEIIAAGYGTLITDENLFEMAKQNIIEDELVEGEGPLDALTFSVV